MNRTLLGLSLAVAMVGATAARADDYRRHHGAVAVTAQQPGPMPYLHPHQQHQGRYELRTVQVWVAEQSQQVWVEGRCFTKRHGRRGRFEHTRCLPGRYETVTTPGHYVAQQQWVWVAYQRPVLRFGVGFEGPRGGGAYVSVR